MPKCSLFVVLAIAGIVAGCTPSLSPGLVLSASAAAPTVTSSAQATPSPTPFQPDQIEIIPPDTPSPVPSPTPSSLPPPTTLWISSAVPSYLRQLIQVSTLPLVSSPGNATIRLDVSAAGDSSTTWIYALVSPFPTLIDGVTLDDIRRAWAGEAGGPFGGKPFRMEDSTLAAFTSIWGAPAPRSVYVVPAGRLLDLTWTERPIWAIVPFEALDPRWKVLTVDGQSPIHKDFDPASYPLKISFSFQPAAFPLPVTNRDPSHLTVLAMTGVTALVRGTADRMEKNGLLYPDVNIRDVLRSADVTHISNEVSFDPNCPTPDLYSSSLRFCSDPRYITLLEDVGTKIVELTGNHLLDYGSTDMLNSLEMYNQRGWSYYGGGKDLSDAQKFITIDDHGNKLAFLGCNPAGPPSDWATADSPGSAPCDYAAMDTNITLLRSAGYLPIVTLQYHEYTSPIPTDYEQKDFRNLAAAGAVIVSGSQAHIPQAMEFYDGTFIHYGLGNLFFDQMSFLLPNGQRSTDSRNEFIDRYVFYAGKLVSVELLTYRLEDYSQPRPMTPAEREQFLKDIFGSSGW